MILVAMISFISRNDAESMPCQNVRMVADAIRTLIMVALDAVLGAMV